MNITDIVQNIIYHLDLISSLRLFSCCKNYNNRLCIEDLKNISKQQRLNLTNDILKQKKFRNLKYLNISNNQNVTEIDHLIRLEILIARGMKCVLNQSSIQNLNLVELDVHNNLRITDLNHMTRLEKLDISQKHLELDQINLHCHHRGCRDCCPHKTAVPLDNKYYKYYYYHNHIGVQQDGINKLAKIINLDLRGNCRIFDVSHFKFLKKIKIGFLQEIFYDSHDNVRFANWIKVGNLIEKVIRQELSMFFDPESGKNPGSEPIENQVYDSTCQPIIDMIDVD